MTVSVDPIRQSVSLSIYNILCNFHRAAGIKDRIHYLRTIPNLICLNFEIQVKLTLEVLLYGEYRVIYLGQSLTNT